jgi:hypothetical protein
MRARWIRAQHVSLRVVDPLRLRQRAIEFAALERHASALQRRGVRSIASAARRGPLRERLIEQCGDAFGRRQARLRDHFAGRRRQQHREPERQRPEPEHRRILERRIVGMAIELQRDAALADPRDDVLVHERPDHRGVADREPTLIADVHQDEPILAARARRGVVPILRPLEFAATTRRKLRECVRRRSVLQQEHSGGDARGERAHSVNSMQTSAVS